MWDNTNWIEKIEEIQFSDEFINQVVERAKESIIDSQNKMTSQKQIIINIKTGYKQKRNKLEDNLLNGTINSETYKRKHQELENEINKLENKIQEIENESMLDVDLINEVLKLTKNINKTYEDASPFLKRHFIRFFYEKFVVNNKEISMKSLRLFLASYCVQNRLY